MTHLIDDEERRARLGRRHLLAPGHQASSPAGVASALTAVHGTDPASTVLGILARTERHSVGAIESALYDERSIVRILGMRRTVFAVEYTLAPAIWSAFDVTVARNQRRLLSKALEACGVENTAAWIAEAESRLLAYLVDHPGSTSTQIASDDPYLAFRVTVGGPAGTTQTQSATSRLLTLMSAEGQVIRARPKGSWTSTQFTWYATQDWRTDWPSQPDRDDADVQIARSWLAGHGPATIDDLAWWTGWPKGRSRKAIEGSGSAEVQTSAGPAFVLETDLEPVTSPSPWVALLPGLDSSTMGWKHRDFYLGPHRHRVFDDVGNAGPTVWVNGRIVGGWAQRESGEIAFEVFDDVGQESLDSIAERAAKLESLLSDVRIKPRARRHTPSELALR